MTSIATRLRSLLQADAATAPLWPLAMARIALGVMWLWSLRWKLPPDFDGGAERSVGDWLDAAVEHAAFGWYGDLIDQLVVPNLTAFSWALFAAEAITGMILVSGAFTRIGAALGLALSVNLGIAMLAVPGEWPWAYAMMVMWHGTFLVSNPGHLWGVDGWLRTTDPHQLRGAAT
ncbi:MAG: hypothetical protein AAF467_19385 [Actinomycetota bacterium]